MATEEVSKPPSLPPYPEMVFEALDALKDKDGSNKSAISKYIESTYGDVPAGHSNLLSHHLNKMKDDGVLMFVKNCYMRFDPSAPPRRGRGRPPKRKTAAAAAAAEVAEEAEVSASPARPRGRPRKDANAPPPAPKEVKSGGVVGSKSGRPRGRPPKVKPQQAQVGVQAS
ncbi:HMG-Y-related protein like [Actinidia chinensis var. chinensis]|uniref:HMG-Y-related protein like n=1 Tax=Actinidia chinensis var. chinensis TaxID=1590841 RepID=A0A2R6S2Y9_ACTCC|nr:HMG-Y-related protein like [Actinidia chinensis var. chinensis]